VEIIHVLLKTEAVLLNIPLTLQSTVNEFIYFTFLTILQFVSSTKVLPQMFPFSFGDDEINLDETVTVSCTITKGDLPINVWWRFTEAGEEMSYNLTSNDGVVITRTSQKVSLLTIEAVKGRHRGNYSCFAQNKAGIAQHSAYLAINGDFLIK